MFSNPMSPEMVRIVHERQIHEAAVRRANLNLAEQRRERLPLRRLIGSALIRTGMAIASEPSLTVHEAGHRSRVSGC